MKPRLNLLNNINALTDKAILQLKGTEPHYNFYSIKAVNPKLIKGEKAYTKTINNVLTKQATTVSNHVQDWEGLLKDRYTFFDTIQLELNNILYDSVPSMEKHIEGFYSVGKSSGFKEMAVKSFFGESDKHALYTLKNYNFDLIRNLSQNHQNNIREAIWQGTARGDSVQSIAKEILIQPLKTVDGRMISPEVRAQSIARTESMQAMNQGHLMSYQQYGVERVDILIGDPNDECADFPDGNPYDINDPNMPELPAHTNCVCTYSPADSPNVEGAMDPDTYVNLVLQGETPVIEV